MRNRHCKVFQISDVRTTMRNRRYKVFGTGHVKCLQQIRLSTRWLVVTTRCLDLIWFFFRLLLICQSESLKLTTYLKRFLGNISDHSLEQSWKQDDQGVSRISCERFFARFLSSGFEQLLQGFARKIFCYGVSYPLSQKRLLKSKGICKIFLNKKDIKFLETKIPREYGIL